MSLDKRMINEGFRKLKNQSRYKDCFHKNCDCSNNIIKAHSIQHKRILSKLAVDGYVMMIDTEDIAGYNMKNIGKKTATTFTGFCGKHDSEIFKPIETTNYIKGNKEQEFLFAYRALAKEYAAKKSCYTFADKFISMYENNDIKKIQEFFPQFNSSTDPNLMNTYNNYLAIRAGSGYAIGKYESYRIAMTSNIKKRKYHSINTFVLEFPEETLIAVSSLINITHDVDGRQICDLSDNRSYFAPLYLTIFPQNGKTFVLMSCYKKDKGFYEFIKKQIVDNNIEKQKIIISNMIAIYCENMVVSPILWEGMSSELRKQYENIFTKTIIDKEPLSTYVGLRIFR